MGPAANIVVTSLLAAGLVLWAFAPSAWARVRGRTPAKPAGDTWAWVLFGLLVISSLAYFRPTEAAGWVDWTAKSGRIVCLAVVAYRLYLR